ncbi:MAG: helicase associated domain-containing protein, partial [Lachnospiraceae bacterium]|nr:helicase associated domain-containing protein [Lachnospiraceae bacterium]
EKCPDKKEQSDAERVLMREPGNGYISRAGLLNAEKIAALDALGMVWDDADYVWEQHFAAAERYYRAHGDLEVASYYVDVDGFLLGKWIIKQRRLWKEKRGMAELPDTKGGHRYSEGKSKNTLTEEQIARLSAIGMLWQGRSHTLWEKSYAAACEYYREHGNLEVPATFVTADGCRLGRWIRGQRNAYQNAVQEHELPKGSRKKTRAQILDAERIKRLEQIGMVWESEDSWEHRFALANKYYREHGNLNLPADYVEDGIWLGRWLREQKARLRAEAVQEPGEEKDICSPEKLESEICEQNRKSSGEFFTPQQREKLYSLGLKGAASQAELAWRRQYGEAEEFYREHGNLAIPKRYIGKSGKSLGVWLQHQRTNRRSGQLTGEQV